MILDLATCPRRKVDGGEIAYRVDLIVQATARPTAAEGREDPATDAKRIPQWGVIDVLPPGTDPGRKVRNVRIVRGWFTAAQIAAFKAEEEPSEPGQVTAYLMKRANRLDPKTSKASLDGLPDRGVLDLDAAASQTLYSAEVKRRQARARPDIIG